MVAESDRKERCAAPVALSWCLVLVWAAFIFFMSAHTGTDLDEGAGFAAQVKRWLSALAVAAVGSADAVSVAAHFLEYTVFGALLFAALFLTVRYREVRRRGSEAGVPAPGGRRLGLLVLGAMALASLYGASDEFHQLSVPGRLCDPADWLTDTCGAALGAVLTACAVRRRKGGGRR